ncbi:IS1182 family transposase [Streptomyces sp. H10-C2]|uniref:IS1182 family transposase n=1 Tax=unclassified Streptomyces TaxID=2593676 RepID=UPI0024BA073B|nr:MULTISPECIES: IS1182 family transposase [unclassified Streptomyces]MDJ0347659.1 IS1182 family transposase [Streptomyces sp. PH10-H1]MDJ0375827.1 IS1182 family transposase [Streptomyces sp. H10-C2]
MFEVEPVEKKQPQGRPAAVDKRFRAFDPHQVLLLPPSLDDWLPQDHLARFVADLVDQVLDLSPVLADYTEKRGYPPYDPRLMVRLLIYGYTTGIRSSRAIERKCADDVAFRYLAADQAPDFRSISRFRRRHLDALADLFTQSLHLAQKLGLVKMGRVALDGTKLEASASKHKAMSYGRLVDKEERVEAEIAQLEAMAAALLADAEASDTAEDQVFGIDGRDVDLPAELDRREKRLAKMQAARAQIEAEAAEKARRHAEDKERRRQGRAGTSDEQAIADAGDKAATAARPKPKAQANFTDPDSRIMKNSKGAYIQAYNAQAVVDEAHQVITAADVTTNPSDALNYTTMLDQSAQNTGIHPGQALVDAGYCSETNLEAAKDRQLDCGTDTFMATGRLAHDEQVPPAPRGRIPASATLKERMARKLRTKPGKAAYRRRKAIVEPVFGQIMTCQNGRQLLLRGEDGARGEWRLLAACHNFRKIFRHARTTGLTAATG